MRVAGIRVPKNCYIWPTLPCIRRSAATREASARPPIGHCPKDWGLPEPLDQNAPPNGFGERHSVDFAGLQLDGPCRTHLRLELRLVGHSHDVLPPAPADHFRLTQP